MIDVQQLGLTIAALRRRMGLTQSELADRLFVTHQSVSKWETGAAVPDTATLFALSRMLGVTMDELISGQVTPQNTLTDWEALDSVGAFLSENTKDLLFDHAVKSGIPPRRLAARLIKAGFLSAQQQEILKKLLQA